MITIEIKDANVNTRTYTNKETGEVTTYYNQTGWVQIEENGYPEKFTVRLEEAKGFAPGLYAMLSSSFYVGQYKDLKVGNLKLERIEEGER